jgi:hypothetical protein
MPKRTIAERPPDDVPVWDELVTELSDPRPYEPSTIDVIIVTDEPCVDDGGFDDVSTDLDDEVERFWHHADELTFEAQRAFAGIITEFEEKHGKLAVPPVVDQSTAYVPTLATLDVESTLVLPVWPTPLDKDVVS